MDLNILIFIIQSPRIILGLPFYKALKIVTTRKSHNGEEGPNEEFSLD